MAFSGSPRLRNSASVLYWVLPPLLCLLVFRRGLLSWFLQDDFAWLRLEMHSFSDFWSLLVEPRAGGSIRPLSERFFFILFRRLFDLRAFPYHLFVFLTQFANLLLLTAIARRLTASRGAALVASLLWTLNISLLTPLAWTSAYNQVLCSFFYLTSFLLFLRQLETGRWSFYWWQCAAFVLGFGALETMAVYPLVLLAYCLLLARPNTWKTLPLLAVSALYIALRFRGAAGSLAGPYAFHFDAGILTALWRYWSWSLGPVRFAEAYGLPAPAALVLVVVLSLALLAALVHAVSASPRLGISASGPSRVPASALFAPALFGLAWFLLTLAPVLPLPDRRFDYYLTIPAIGLALAIACLLPSVPRWAAALWLLIYFSCSIAFIEKELRLHYRRSQLARRLIAGLQAARTFHPGRTILLTGVNDQLFYAVLYDEGPRTAGLRHIYLAPTNPRLTTAPGLAPVENYRLPARATLAALQSRLAEVYDVSQGNLRNITTLYTLSAPDLLKPTPPRRVDVGEPLLASQIGSGWSEIDLDHRWMSRRAEVRLAAPQSPGDRLRIEAINPEYSHSGPFLLAVSANGVRLGRVEIRDERSCRRFFDLPASFLGAEEITIALEIEDAGAERLAFGVIELIHQP